MPGDPLAAVGAIAIGKNEGDRLHACLQSLVGRVPHVVYVDSGSTDGSVALAESLGVEVVLLDTTTPFTAARARNAGFERLRQVAPGVELVMFVDGDCEVVEGWLEGATEFLADRPSYAVACGRRRERDPDASTYNYLCDVEWNTPVGDAKACGGDAMFRGKMLAEVGGFDGQLIAGEEPELCVRLRARGWKIRRLDREMTRHDAAITQFSQWWKRSTRAGHAFAEGAAMHGAAPERHWVRESRRSVFWGLLLPIAAVAATALAPGFGWVLWLAYPVSLIRMALRFGAAGVTRPWALAWFTMLGKFPEAVGWLRFQWGRLFGRRSQLIEYKGTGSGS